MHGRSIRQLSHCSTCSSDHGHPSLASEWANSSGFDHRRGRTRGSASSMMLVQSFHSWEVHRLIITDEEPERDVTFGDLPEFPDGVNGVAGAISIQLDVTQLGSLDSIDHQFNHEAPVNSACRWIVHLVRADYSRDVQEFPCFNQGCRLWRKFGMCAGWWIECSAEEHDGSLASHVYSIIPSVC